MEITSEITFDLEIIGIKCFGQFGCGKSSIRNALNKSITHFNFFVEILPGFFGEGKS